MARPRIEVPKFHINALRGTFNGPAIVKFRLKKGRHCDFKFRKRSGRLYFIFNKENIGIPCGKPNTVNQSVLCIHKKFKKLKIPIVTGKFDLKRNKKNKLWYIKLTKGQKNGKS